MDTDQFEEEFQEQVQDLRQHKVRMTEQRLLILKYMMTHQNHPTAEMVYNDLKDEVTSNVSIATVYNNLKFLAKITPINELTYDDRSIHFDYYHQEHFHAICRICGQVYDINYHDYESLKQRLIKDSEFEIEKIELNIQGICKKCQKGVAKVEKS